MHQLHERDGRVDIGRLGRSHTLDCDRIPVTDRDRTNFDGSGGVSLDIYHGRPLK